jgi:hypothetical protein
MRVKKHAYSNRPLRASPPRQRERPREHKQHGAADAVKPERSALLEQSEDGAAGSGVAEHEREVDRAEHRADHQVLHELRARRVDELGQKRPGEEVGLGVGDGNDEAAREDGAPRAVWVVIVESRQAAFQEQQGRCRGKQGRRRPPT